MKRLNRTLLFGLLAFLPWIGCNLLLNGYGKHRTVPVTVIDKMGLNGMYGSNNLYFVVEREDGYQFDIIVSPTTFSRRHIGDRVTFNLRPFDMEQVFWKTCVFVASMFAFVLGLIGVGYTVYDLWKRGLMPIPLSESEEREVERLKEYAR